MCAISYVLIRLYSLLPLVTLAARYVAVHGKLTENNQNTTTYVYMRVQPTQHYVYTHVLTPNLDAIIQMMRIWNKACNAATL